MQFSTNKDGVLSRKKRFNLFKTSQDCAVVTPRDDIFETKESEKGF